MKLGTSIVKGILNIAEFPIEEESGECTRNDYVGIPYIMEVLRDQYIVFIDESKSSPLSDWLN